jgi:dihydropteroate synthase
MNPAMNPVPVAEPATTNDPVLNDLALLDNQLSNRFIKLDPGGYFIIYVNREQGQICAEHFTNTIDDRGLACDPETGEPLACSGSLPRSATHVYSGRTAKELCIALFEANPNETHPNCPVTYLDHAAYLGREFQKAEAALRGGWDYVQD